MPDYKVVATFYLEADSENAAEQRVAEALDRAPWSEYPDIDKDEAIVRVELAETS